MSAVRALTAQRITVCVLLVVSAAAADNLVQRTPGETLSHFCGRLLPAGMEFAHPPVELSIGAGGPKSIVMLFRRANDVNTNYTGWVLTPEYANSYAIHVLPPMREIPSQFDIDVKAVFDARIDSQMSWDLVILYEYHRNGSETDSGFASYLYHCSGREEFVALNNISSQLAGLKTAIEVREKLRRMKLRASENY